MDRRSFLKSSGGAATAAAGAATIAAGAHAATTDAATASLPTTPAGTLAHPAVQRAAKPFVLAVPSSLDHIEIMTAAHCIAAQLQTASDGKYVVSVAACEGSGLDAVASGAAQAYLGLESQHSHRHPAFALLSGLPLGVELDPALHLAWLADSTTRDSRDALAAEVGAIAFPAFHTGRSPGLYSDHLLETADALRGARIDARGLAATVVASLGAHVVTAAAGDSAGAIEARGLAALEPLMAPSAAVAHWTYAPGLTPGGHVLTLGVGLDTWMQLSPSEHVAIDGIAAASLLASMASTHLRAATARRIDAWRRWPVATTASTTLDRDLRDAGRMIVDRLARHDALARDLVAGLQRFHAATTVDSWLTPPALS